MNSSVLFILLSVFTLSYGYPIEGNWLVQSILGSSIPASNDLTLTINEFIYRNSSIRWALAFQGCQTIKYQMEIDENNIFIDFDTQLIVTEKNLSCPFSQLVLERSLNADLRKIFTFEIFNEFLTFSDPTGKVIFKFSRIIKPKQPRDITGSWNIANLEGKKFNQVIQINETHLIFCQRVASFEYKVESTEFADKLILTNLIDRGCQFSNFIKEFQKIQYFRFLNQKIPSIQLYDTSDQIITILYFIMDLQTTRKQQERIRTKQNSLNNSNSQPNQTIIQVVKNLSGNISDIEGKWKIKSIYGIPNFVESLEITITSINIILSGGCNTHVILYQQGNKKKQINVGVLRSTKILCKVDDDGLFVAGLGKIMKYDVKIIDREISLTFYDQNNKTIFDLTKPVEIQRLIIRNTTTSEPTPPIKVIAQPFPSGRYMILLLKRRDLPRKFVNVDFKKKQISFKICNDMLFSFVLNQQQDTIDIVSADSSSNAKCTQNQLNQENVFTENLLSAKYFANEKGDINLLDQNKEQIVAFNLL